MSAYAHFQSQSRISVRALGGEPLAVSPSGLVQCNGARVLILRLTHIHEDPTERTFVCMVDGKKQLIKKKEMVNSEGRYFECRYDLGNKDHIHANVLRMIRMNKRGEYEVVELGIALQNHKPFLTMQVLYQDACFQDAGCTVIPRFEEPWVREHWHVNPWPVMVDRLRIMLDELDVEPKDLPCISTFVPPVVERLAQENVGIVVFFNNMKGYGVVRTKHGLAHVSYQQIVAPGCEFRKLSPGDRVAYLQRIETDGLGYPATLHGVRCVA